MKKIFLLIVTVLVASVSYTADAQGILFAHKPDSTKVRKAINRIDRHIDQNAFAYKNEWICGVSASYGTLSTDDSDLALLVENLRLGGSVVSVKPYFGWFYRDNLSIGLRLGYTHMVGNFDNANINLGNFINGLEFSTEGVALKYLSNAYSFSFFHRAYVPIDKRGRFGVFGELELCKHCMHHRRRDGKGSQWILQGTL